MDDNKLPPCISPRDWEKVREQAKRFMGVVDKEYMYPCHKCDLTWHEHRFEEFRTHMKTEHGQYISPAMKEYYKVLKL